MKRAPLRDRWHSVNAVNKTGHEGLPEQKSELGSDLVGALAEIPESELVPVINWIRQSRKPKPDISKARSIALADYRRTGFIRTRSFGREKQVKEWQRVRAKWAEKKQLAQQRGQRSVIRSKSAWPTQQGTLEEMDAIEPCITKGCLEDPMVSLLAI